jgi:isocitrate dehydrogenase
MEENGTLCTVCDNHELNVDSWEGFEFICSACKSEMEKAIKNIQPEEWACWTLSTEDIIAIAKNKGISLKDKSTEDIARQVKKGIQWSLDEHWESIVADSIRDSARERQT